MNTTQSTEALTFVIASAGRDGRIRYIDRFGAWTTNVELAAKFDEDEDAEDFATAEGVSLLTADVTAI